MPLSGPIDELAATAGDRVLSTIEVRPGRSARIGRMDIVRVLPTKRRRAIGPWCFVDLMSPEDVTDPPPLEIGPHPHIGLATVTWLFVGSALHSDSLGTQQLIRPEQLNLMTSGRGIAHAELGIDTSAATHTGGIVGVQMWLAQSDATRNGGSRFQHVPDIPLVGLTGGSEARVLIGELSGTVSPATFDHPTVGIEVTVRPAASVPTDPAFEHAVVPIDRTVLVGDTIVEPGALAIVPPGTEELSISVASGSGTVLVLGGEPLGVDLAMWWNFVARTRDELTEAWLAWERHDDDRFGPVPSTLARVGAPSPPWLML